jgi:integrase/recombinase XerD
MADLQSFTLYLRRKGRAQTTIDYYTFIVEHIYKHTSFEDLDSYFLKKLDAGTSPNTLNNQIKVLRVYGKCVGNEILAKLESFAGRESEKSILSDTEIEAICNLKPLARGKFAETFYRNSLMWRCLAYSGARAGEISKLTVDLVDFGSMLFHLDGKSGKRKAAINPILIDELTAYVKTVKGKYLFHATYNHNLPISCVSWNKDFSSRLRRLQITRSGISPHSLRHSFITRNWKQGILFIQKQVGHKKLETTAKYAHLVTDDLIEGIKMDRLGKKDLSYTDKFGDVWKRLKVILDEVSDSPEEEKKIRQDLLTLL